MDFFRVKTSVVLNQERGKALRRRAQQLRNQARRITRNKAPVSTMHDWMLRHVDDIPNRKDLPEAAKALKRAARKLRQPNHDVAARGRANQLRDHALDLLEQGAVGRRYLHLFWSYLRGRAYHECEAETRKGNEAKVQYLAEAFDRRRNEWKVKPEDMELLEGLKLWLEDGELTREEVFEELGKSEAAWWT